MGPTDFGCLDRRKEFCAREIAYREGWPGLEFRSCSAVRECRARRIGESIDKSCESRGAIARRPRQGRSLRCEDQLRVELGVTTLAGGVDLSCEKSTLSVMKKLGRGILLLGVFLVLVIVPALHAQDTYAAIAYHQSTHTWAYSNAAATKEEAIAEALRKCGHSQAKTTW